MTIKDKIEALSVIIAIIALIFLIYSIIPTVKYKVYHKRKKTISNDKLYLTFDDGPHPVYTAKLMDLLERYNVKASFFVVGEFAKNNPDIINRMKNDGHLICMHSLKHKNGFFQCPIDTKLDFEKSIKILEELNVQTKFFRPPWGHFNLATHSIMKEKNIQPLLWDVMVQDWKSNTNSIEIIEKLSERAKAGDIICLHDGRGKNEAPLKTIQALEVMIPVWLSKGYSFYTVDNYESK